MLRPGMWPTALSLEKKGKLSSRPTIETKRPSRHQHQSHTVALIRRGIGNYSSYSPQMQSWLAHLRVVGIT